jgi:DNA polymerase III alpha subunit
MYVPMSDWLSPVPPPGRWPRPPAALPHARLVEPPHGARVTVAGLVLLRQRPGTAKGVIFVTLEDETGVANVVVRARVFERFRRAVIAGRLLRVTGRLQREAGVVHVVAEQVEDLSPLLDRLLSPGFRPEEHRAGDTPQRSTG